MSDLGELKTIIEELKKKLFETQNLYLTELNKLSAKLPCYKQSVIDKNMYNKLQEENGDLHEENGDLHEDIDDLMEDIEYLKNEAETLKKQLKKKNKRSLEDLWKSDGEDSVSEDTDSEDTDNKDNNLKNTQLAPVKHDAVKDDKKEEIPSPTVFGQEAEMPPQTLLIAPLVF
jgi:predicted  nucleic acid-binding Zn-ribbon protein